MKRSNSRMPRVIAAAALLAVLGYLGWILTAPEPVDLVSTPQVPVAVAPPVAVQPEPAEPALAEPAAIENPIEALTAEDALTAPVAVPALNGSDSLVAEQLTTLLGRKSVLGFLQLDGFVRRVVATVDNLARSQASAKLWPVNPTPQRFTTQKQSNGGEVIHPDNSKRYAALVQMIEAVDTTKAVDLYRGLYPVFQQAYEELGFPKGYFNDRLVQVLDHLIATPMPTEPLAVTLVEVKGTVPSLRPWVRYEFADPEREAMSAGRKMLLRTGPDNQRRLQAKLKEIRQRVAKPS
jgi:hypothetical protein